MSPEISSLLLALGIFSVGFVSIGPNILAIIGTSMERGRRAGVKLALGVAWFSGLGNGHRCRSDGSYHRLRWYCDAA